MDPGGTDVPRANEPGSDRPAVSPAAVALPPPSRPAPSTAEPKLPTNDPAAPPAMADYRSAAVDPTATWYRNDQQRQRSVYRRANPIYRRIARGLIGLSIVSFLAIAVYVGGGAANDYLKRDKLPGIGAEPTAFRSTTFLITSTAPAPRLNGTLKLDTSTGGFLFAGAGASSAGIDVMSTDGSTMLVRRNGGPWTPATTSDEIIADLTRALPALLNVRGPDDVLERQLRRGYLDLVDKTVAGLGDDARDTYQINANMGAFRADHPIEWEDYTNDVIPGVVSNPAVPLTLTVDQDDVVVRLRDDETHWSWERLNYSTAAFDPSAP